MTTETLLAADSFRTAMIDAAGGPAARGFKRHLERFTRTAGRMWLRAHPASAGTMDLALRAFLADAVPQITAYTREHGEAFPRLELWQADGDTPVLRLSLRPCPPLTTELTATSHATSAAPYAREKGPNIARYRELTATAGGEVLLLDPAGTVREGTTTSILWWDGPVLRCSASPERVASVTEWLLGFMFGWAASPAAAGARAAGGAVALAAGFALAPGSLLGPADVAAHSPGGSPAATSRALAGTEVWAVNALHGIRPVSEIDGVPLAAPDEERLAACRTLLDFAWQPVRLEEAHNH